MVGIDGTPVGTGDRIDVMGEGWFLSYSLEERLAAGEPLGGSDSARGRRRLAMWQKEPIFLNDAERLPQLLERMGVSEADFVELLGEPATSVRSRFTGEPGFVATIARAWQRYGDWSDHDGIGTASGGTGPDDSPDHHHDHNCATAAGHQHDAAAQLGFAAIVRPLLRDAVDRVRVGVAAAVAARHSPHLDVQVLIDRLTQPPVQAVVQLISRTAVLELNVLRIQGALKGVTPEERFASFVERMKEPEHATALLQEYPVLARELVRLLDNWVHTQVEFIERLVADVADVVGQFPAADALGAVAEVRFGAGDTHRGGRSVGIVTFANGDKVVYKPRRLGVDRHFHELVDWINARGQEPALRTFWIIDKGDYGWTEFVKAEPCTDKAALGRFYRRQGAYLGLLHALAATDFHLENLIAAGEHPVLVDLEALFHPWQPAVPKMLDLPPDAFALMRSSVLSVGLLPNPITWKDENGLGQADLSGLAGGSGQLSPSAVPTWDGAGTDTMRLVRRRIEMAGADNLPTLAGDAVNALDYRAELVAGHEAMYRLLLDHRQDLLAADGPLTGFADDEIRVIVRPTRTYAMLMLESNHPDLLRDALDRDRFLNNMWAGHEGVVHQDSLITAELAQLRRGDVPIFWTTPTSTDLNAGTGGVVITGALERSGMDRALDRLRALSSDDLVRQTWFIEASLAAIAMAGTDPGSATGPGPSNGDGVPEPGPVNGVTSRQARPDVGTGQSAAQRDPAAPGYLDAAQRVGDRLVTIALGDDSISWLGLNLVGDRLWQLSPAGMDMFNGLSGIGLFLGYLAELGGSPRHRTAAQRTADVMVQHIDRLDEAPEEDVQRSIVGAFNGLGGTVYALAHLAVLWNRHDLAEAAGRMLTWIDGCVDHDESLDVISGSAGGILASLALHVARPQDPRPVEVARRMAEHVVANARDTGDGIGWCTDISSAVPLGGFSHGASGIAVALSRLDRAVDERRYASVVRGALRYERSLYDHDLGNWRDLRPITPDKMNMVAWCHGAAGIGMARADLEEYLSDDPTVAEDLTWASKAVIDRGLRLGNHSICHGDLGNIEALLVMGERLADSGVLEVGRSAAVAALADINVNGWRCGVPLGVETPGLMPGLAGIGFNLLRLERPDLVPSVLLGEPPREGGR